MESNLFLQGMDTQMRGDGYPESTDHLLIKDLGFDRPFLGAIQLNCVMTQNPWLSFRHNQLLSSQSKSFIFSGLCTTSIA